MSQTSGKKFSFKKLLLWLAVIFIALQIFSDGEFGEELLELFQDDDSHYTEYTPSVGYLGVTIDSRMDGEGGYVASVVPDSPADDAGLLSGDIVVRVGNTTITSAEELRSLLSDHYAGDQLDITVLRGEEHISLWVILGTKPSESTEPSESTKPSATESSEPLDATTAPVHTDPPATEPAPTEVYLPGVPDELQDHVYLTTRKSSVWTSMSGNIPITMLFVSDPEGSWTDSEMADFKQQLQDGVSRITADAAKFGVSVNFTFHYKTVSVSETIVDADAVAWIESALRSTGLPERKKLRNHLKSYYGTPSAPVFFAVDHSGRDISYMGYGYALLYKTAEAFYHELAHLYGSRDFYFPQEVEDAAETYLPESIMMYSDTGVMDDLTAYLVGWTEQPSGSAPDFLHATKHITQDYLQEEKDKELYTGYVTNFTYDGVTYTGYLVNGQLHGEGTFISDAKELTGIFDHGIFIQGTGILRYTNGTVYNGQWQNGLRHGYGTIVYANGDCYEGDFQNDLFHGQGTLTWADGTKYIGAFADGKRHGHGVYYYSNGNRYEGNWVVGDRNGQGTMYYSDGAVYTGQWADNQRHGQGTMHYSDGAVYIGQWKDNQRNGQGAITYASGNRYEGNWADDNRNGQGSYFWTNGDRYVGQFKDGKLHGEGVYYYANGSSKTGIWENGSFVG